MKAVLVSIAVTVFAIIFLSLFVRPSSAQEKSSQYPHEQVTIETASGQKHFFDMEIAKTAEQRERGLMFRRSMPKDSGMMFIFWPPETVVFWMKNTHMPLDMLFVRADGAIVKIVSNAKPLDLSIQSSNENVIAVIELNGGEAQRRSIKPGDKVLAKVLMERH